MANFDVLKATGFLNEGALSGSRQSHDSDDYRGLDGIAGGFDKVEICHCNCPTGLFLWKQIHLEKQVKPVVVVSWCRVDEEKL